MLLNLLDLVTYPAYVGDHPCRTTLDGYLQGVRQEWLQHEIDLAIST